MIRLVFGLAGSGKSHTIRRMAADVAKNGGRAMLIVPEQYSLENERALFSLCGAAGAGRAEVLSFTRLCELIFREMGTGAGHRLHDTARQLMVSQALYELRDQLGAYASQADKPGFSARAMRMIDEFKYAGIAPADLMALKLPDTSLQQKIRDLALIYEAYEAYLHRGWLDPADDITRAAKLVPESAFFSDVAVFFDGFKDFTGQQRSLIREMLGRAKEVTFSFCLDALSGRSPVFRLSRKAALGVLSEARRQGLRVATPIHCETSHRYGNSELSFLAKNLFCERGIYDEAPERVELVRARNKHEEIRFVAADILRKVRDEGMRFRDFAVIGRGMEGYIPVIQRIFSGAGIPVYDDRRREITSQPLVTLCVGALETLSDGLSTDSLLTILKTGLCGVPEAVVLELENYAYLWRLGSGDWRQRFYKHPRGFAGTMTPEDEALLERLEAVRETLVPAIEAFRGKARRNGCREIAEALWELLQALGVEDGVRAAAETLRREAGAALGDQAVAVWNAMCGVLDVMVSSLGREQMDGTRFLDLFTMAVQSVDLGQLPEGVDQVMAGEAGRIRADNIRAAYLVGVSQGVFPKTPAEDGLLSFFDRAALKKAGLFALQDADDQTADELFCAYTAATCAADSLTVVFPMADGKGAPLRESTMVEELRSALPRLAVQDVWRMGAGRLGQNAALSFDWLAKSGAKTSEGVAVRAALRALPGFSERIHRVEQESQTRVFALSDATRARRLFGREMRLSPSKLERFYQCPFAYFCESGLKVLPRRRAELSPMVTGTVVHEMLDRLLAVYDIRTLRSLPEGALEKTIRELLSQYIEERMGGAGDKSRRFAYLMGRMRRTLRDLALHLCDEFCQSEFSPEDFELAIARNGAVPPLSLHTATGERIVVEGKVDRVDIMERGGKRYVRVVDYKSGGKDFDLSDVYYGMNLQMLVYLFSIWKNGTGKYQNVWPAGVLYLPAKAPEPSIERGLSDEQVAAKIRGAYRMNGLVLHDEAVIRGMERAASGVYIPVKLKKDGMPSGEKSLASLEQMGALSRHLEGMIQKTAESLYGGDIAARPGRGKDWSGCDWCEYHPICLHRPTDEAEERQDLDAKTIWSRLGVGGEEEAEDAKLDD